MQFIGNQKIVTLLQNSLEKERVNHAYIFSGPQHVGKLALAKMFSEALISGQKNILEAGQADKNVPLDMLLIAPEEIEKNGIKKKRDISIEKIRDAQQSLSLYPYHGKYKILIIDDAHKMTTASQNALLKTLEEPNATSNLILITHEIDKILPTVLSRCQTLVFSLVEDAELEKVFSADTTLLSMGRPGLAKEISEMNIDESLQAKARQQYELAVGGNLGEKLKLAEEMAKNIPEAIAKMDVWLWLSRAHALKSSALASDVLYANIEKIQKSLTALKSTNANGRLALEALFVGLEK